MIEGLIFDCQEKQIPHCAPIQTSRHFHRDSRGIGFKHQTRAAVCRLGESEVKFSGLCDIKQIGKCISQTLFDQQ